MTEAVAEVWENQRYVVFKGWGEYRLPTDRPSWSTKKGDVLLFKETTMLPVGWEWVSSWEVAPHGDNVEGWYYAADFTIPTRFCTRKSNKLSLVRRRKWVRTRRQVSSLNPDTVFLFSTWTGTIFYGFPGPTIADQETEQARQHRSFLHLSRLLTAGEVSFTAMSPRKANSNSGEEGDEQSPEVAPPPDELVDSFGLSSPTLDFKHVRAVCKYGVANCLRRQLWLQWSGATLMKSQYPGYFQSLVSSTRQEGQEFDEIAQDVVRTAPKHAFFDGMGSPGSIRLTSTLLALCAHESIPPYHQAFSYIVAILLLNMSAEDAFWTMVVVVEKLLPQGYHDNYVLQHDLRILNELLIEVFPDVEAHFEQRQIDVSVFASGWLQGLYCAHFPFPSSCRILDVMFAEGSSTVLVRAILAFIRINKAQLLQCDGSGTLGQFANSWARDKYSMDDVMEAIANDTLGPRIAKRREELAVAQRKADAEIREGSPAEPPPPNSQSPTL